MRNPSASDMSVVFDSVTFPDFQCAPTEKLESCDCQVSHEWHFFSSRAYLDKDVAVSEELIQKYSHVVLGHFNSTVKELRRLFLVDDLVDSLKVRYLLCRFLAF